MIQHTLPAFCVRTLPILFFLISPFYKRGNQGVEGLGKLPEAAWKIAELEFKPPKPCSPQQPHACLLCKQWQQRPFPLVCLLMLYWKHLQRTFIAYLQGLCLYLPLLLRIYLSLISSWFHKYEIKQKMTGFYIFVYLLLRKHYHHGEREQLK